MDLRTLFVYDIEDLLVIAVLRGKFCISECYNCVVRVVTPAFVVQRYE
jgi:hypothetical protein